MSSSDVYNSIPTVLSQNEFNQFVLPHLSSGTRGPKPKLSFFKIFNYILHLMHTGCQWKKLPIDLDENGQPEIHYSRLFRHFKRWIKDGCFEEILTSSVALLSNNKLLDIGILHGDGTTTAAKKGETILATMDIKK